MYNKQVFSFLAGCMKQPGHREGMGFFCVSQKERRNYFLKISGLLRGDTEEPKGCEGEVLAIETDDWISARGKSGRGVSL